MNCACRTSPWRLFVRSLAQVHNVERLVARTLRAPSTTASRLSVAWTQGQYRRVHGSSALKQDEAAAKPQDTPKIRRATQSSPERRLEKEQQVDEPESLLPTKTAEYWKLQKAALKEKFPEGWRPRKRLSPDALAGIRALNAQFPDVYTTQALADKFEVSPEAIRRILKSKWSPKTADEEQDRQERWFRRGVQVWEQKAALGVKPPKKWRREGVARDSEYRERRSKKAQREKDWEAGERRKYRQVLDVNRGIHIGGGGSN